MSSANAQRTALFVGAHLPGRGSGTGLRAIVTLRALRSCCSRVDVVALEIPGEGRWAEPGTHRIARRPDPSRVARVAALRYGSAYYAPERAVGLTSHLRELVRRGVLLERYDVVLASQSLTARAAHDAVGAGVRILDADNVAATDRRRAADDPKVSRALRGYRRLAAAALAREERARCNLYDIVLVASELEVERLGPLETEVMVLPNTVDAAERVSVERTSRRMLFVGSLGYEPNVDGVAWIAGEILPLVRDSVPAVELTVLGRNPAPDVVRLCRDSDIELIADAPVLEPYYQRSRLLLAPLRLGGGTRIKILEALARGEPVVATPTAAEGLQVRDGVDILLGEDAVGLAKACVQLLENAPLAARIGAAAHRTWSSHYRPELAVAQIVELVERLAPIP